MFDFIKNIRNKKELNSKKDNYNGVTYVCDKELEKEINDFLRWSTFYNNKLFGLVLLKLGFDSDKNLYLKRSENEDILEFYYSFDGVNYSDKKIEFYKNIKTNMLYYDADYCVSIGDDSLSTTYYIILASSDEGSFKLEKRNETINKNINGVEYLRDIRSDNLYINIKWPNDIEFSLICHGEFDLKFDVELELQNYLLNITPSIPVFKIYEKIYEIVFKDDNIFKSIDFGFKSNKKTLSSLRYYPNGINNTMFPKETFEIEDIDRKIAYYRYLHVYYDLYEDEKIRTVKINVVSGDYSFDLIVEPFVYNVSLHPVKLDNEIEIRDYLLSIEFPIKIEDVYKKVVDISLGDVSKYKLIELNLKYKNDSIEKLVLNEGNLKCYRIIRDGKVIEVDDKDTFIYKSNDKDRSLSIDMVGNKIKRYEFISSEGINVDTDNRIENPLEMVINEVKREKVKTKKLIDSIIK